MGEPQDGADKGLPSHPNTEGVLGMMEGAEAMARSWCSMGKPQGH